ncbi:MAG: LuxR C-terminal-related transcriptional regulator [Gammaproteobacteria bacterium]|nr:LuxR C-terminal-related transcriptional regulator [Gammaproteobacteria bacterium]
MSTQLHEHFNDFMLTPTERHFLKLLNEGKTPQDITDLLGLSRLSVDFHFKNIIQKFKTLMVTTE